MNCRYVQSRLSAYLDFELSGAEQQQIRTHLEQCMICSRELEGLRRTKQLLRQLPTVRAQGGAQQVLQRLRQETAPLPRKAFAFTWRSIRWWQFAGGVALAVAFVLWNNTETREPTFTSNTSIPFQTFTTSTSRTPLLYEPAAYGPLITQTSLQFRRTPNLAPEPMPFSTVSYTDPLLNHQQLGAWPGVLVEPKLIETSR